MNVLVFDNQITGHHLEYLHHILVMAGENSNDSFVFVVPKQINEIKDNLEWPVYPNVSYDYLDNEIRPASTYVMDMLKASFILCKILRTLTIKHSIDVVFTNGIMAFVPFASLFFPSKTKIAGIIYQIYLYNDRESSLITKVFNRFKYIILSKGKVYKKVFILNSLKSASELNRIFKTSKFTYLPDPVLELPNNTNLNLKAHYEIPSEKTVFVHFGELSERKGTLNIVKSLKHFKADKLNRSVFIFAGVVKSEIKEQFYSLIKDYDNIIVEDKFCSYNYLSALCKCADVILLPYLITNLSSGLLSYASQYETPVIAPKTGLIGELVEEYKLGRLLNANTPEVIAQECVIAIENRIEKPTKEYSNSHSVTAFNTIIYNNLVE